MKYYDPSIEEDVLTMFSEVVQDTYKRFGVDFNTDFSRYTSNDYISDNRYDSLFDSDEDKKEILSKLYCIKSGLSAISIEKDKVCNEEKKHKLFDKKNI